MAELKMADKKQNGRQKKKMADSVIFRARDLKFSPKILKKYFRNRFEKNFIVKK